MMNIKKILGKKKRTKEFVKDYVKFNKNVELESFALGLVDGVKQFEDDEE